jgi:hypothetical protein
VVKLSVKWIKVLIGDVDVTKGHGVIDTANGYVAAITVANGGTVQPALYLYENSAPLQAAGFVTAAAIAETTFGGAKSIDATDAPWIVGSGGAFGKKNYLLAPFASAIWANQNQPLTKVYSEGSAQGDYKEILCFAGEPLTLPTPSTNNSWGRFYARMDFRPFGVATATKWSIWPGLNYTKVHTSTYSAGGSKLYKIGTVPSLTDTDITPQGGVNIDFGSDEF